MDIFGASLKPDFSLQEGQATTRGGIREFPVLPFCQYGNMAIWQYGNTGVQDFLFRAS
jgi:hypothetical protein